MWKLLKSMIVHPTHLAKTKVAFNPFPYGMFFVFGNILNEFMVFFKVREFRKQKKKHDLDVNKYL